VPLFYIYQYFDPIRKEPIYIGKGSGKRYLYHLYRRNTKNTPFYNRIKWIKKQGREPLITKLHEDFSEEKVFKIETNLIKKIGRKDLGKGPLLNLTDGGEGKSGFKFSKESINKMRGHKRTQEEKDNISKHNSKSWKIIFPCGKTIKIKNLFNFCKENKLDQGTMSHVASGKNKSYKGYICQKL
jgi:hypothetical protein